MIIYYNFISIHNLGINASKDEIDKVCKELENVKLEMKSFKYQVSRDMFVLLLWKHKTPKRIILFWSRKTFDGSF